MDQTSKVFKGKPKKIVKTVQKRVRLLIRGPSSDCPRRRGFLRPDRVAPKAPPPRFAAARLPAVWHALDRSPT